MPTEKSTSSLSGLASPPGIIALAGILLFPEAAGAQTFQIDTYGNGQFIAEVLNSIAILAGSGLIGLVRLGLVAGILLAVMSSLFGGRMMPGHQFALSLLIYMMLFGVRVDIAVFDRVTSYTRVVSAVPAGVGVFAWATSAVGSGLTRLMETAFSTPDALHYSENGLLRGAELIKRSTAFTVAEPHLANTVSSFVRECGLKGVTSGLITPDTLEKSADLFSSMGMANYRFVELHTNIVLPAGAYASPPSAGDCSAAGRPVLAYCGEAHAGINACLDAYYPGWAAELAEESGFVNRQTNTVDTAGFAEALRESYRELAGVSMSAKDIIIQNAMINSYSRSVKSLAVAGGSEASLLSLSIAEARARQKNSFLVLGEMARHTLPYIRGLLQGMLYGIFPAVIFLAMTPLAARIIPAYLIAMLWTELWNPIYAIVNLFSNLKLRRALEPYTDGVLTVISRGSVVHESDMAMAVAGLAATIVPMIAYYVVSASQHAVVGAVQQFMGPTQSISTQTAGAHAAGNISLGNVSVATGRYDTVTANKSDVARETVTGNLSRRYENVYEQPASSVGGMRITGTEGVRFAAREELADTMRSMETSREAVTDSAAAASVRVVGASRAAADQRSYSEVLGLSSTTGEKKDLATVLETAENLQRRFGLSRQESLKMSWDTAMVYEAGARAGTSSGLAGGGVGGPSISAGIKARGARKTDTSAAERYEEAQEFASSSNSRVNFSTAFSELESTLSSKEARESLQFTARDSEEARAELRSAKSSFRDYSSHRERARAYSEVLSGERSFGAGLEREYTQAVFADMRGQGHTDSYVARGLTDLRDGRYDTEEAEAVSGSIHRVTGLSELLGAGSGTRESVAAIPADGYGLGDVRRFEVDAEAAFAEYGKSAGAAGGAGVEWTRSSIEEDSAAVREEVARARERARGGIGNAETKIPEGSGTGQEEILEGGERLQRSTKGVRERLDNAKSESASREQKTSRIKKTIESSRAQQRKNNGAG
ncbi:MAG: conjugal transfer protein TraG N-terminal domain-containing protein [Candidatus Dadabacteria bacterium]|nr:conjugal transfer protein TraG N-terminal domain-containing protein [Candidatus Dadabacteria bacterium]MDE0477587.1 conjugal transfer protein TraG N-terminal domain-containing protein [Candidatus Dadabacteria bacterium]